MNYRHAFHAGNFADVVKHAILALLIERLKGLDMPPRRIKKMKAIPTASGIQF